jgi:alkylhydroperoxidase family enzyme
LGAAKLLELCTFEESLHFDEAERCVLRLTREVTWIQQGVQEAIYQAAVQCLGASYTAQVILAASMINLWNRLGIAARLAPPMEG